MSRKPYIREVSKTGWYLKHPRYMRYMSREVTASGMRGRASGPRAASLGFVRCSPDRPLEFSGHGADPGFLDLQRHQLV